MKLEINLVKVSGMDSGLGRLIARERYENLELVMTHFKSFIDKNMDTFLAAISDKTFLDRLSRQETYTIDLIHELRYFLTSNGLDLWIFQVANEEVNGAGIGESSYEYNIIDSYDTGDSSWIRRSSKMVATSENNRLTSIYQKIQEAYGLFDAELFSSFNNPFKTALDAMKSEEEVLGRPSVTKSSYCTNVLNFLGKEIKVIMN